MNIPDEWKGLALAAERLPDEAPEAYAAFLAFSSMHAAERTIEKAAKQSSFSEASCRIWSQHHSWMDRASAVDAQRWLHDHIEREKLQAEDNKRFVAANREIKETSISTARKMLKIANNLLETADLAGETVETGMVLTADGREVPTHTTINMRSKVSDIPRLVETAVKVSRLAADLPTEIIEPVHKIAQAGDLTQLSDEELDGLIRDNRDKFDKLVGAQSFDSIA